MKDGARDSQPKWPKKNTGEQLSHGHMIIWPQVRGAQERHHRWRLGGPLSLPDALMVTKQTSLQVGVPTSPWGLYKHKSQNNATVAQIDILKRQRALPYFTKKNRKFVI